MRKAFLFAVLLILTLQVSPSRADTPQCGSFQFSINREGIVHVLDVATLRHNRPELYELLGDEGIRGFYLYDIEKGVAQIHTNAMLEATPPGTRKEDLERFIKFMVVEASTFFEDWIWGCGSMIDNMAGELSLTFTKSEGDQLLQHLHTPLVGRFLKFVSRPQGLRVSREIWQSFSSSAFEDAKTRLVVKCRSAGIDPSVCERLGKHRLPPSRVDGSPSASPSGGQ